jgi:diguanylate cyclase (GGDEF)-like protein/PAS domain S-box-containing protein
MGVADNWKMQRRRLPAAARGDRTRHLGSSNQHLQLALQVARMSSWEWNLETGEVVWSRDQEALDGFVPGSFGGTLQAFLDLVHADDVDRVRQALAQAAEMRSGFEIEFRIVLPDGQIRWRTAAGDAIKDTPGQPTHMIGVGRDITERKEAEERLLQAEGKFRTLVEQLPLVSYVEGLDDESAMYISPQIADLVGHTAAEWVADPSFFARVLHPDDRKRVLAGFALMHESGEPLECEYRVIAHDGRVVWIHDAAVVVHDETGHPLYAQGYMIDISERKANEEALRKSHEQLREQMEKVEHQALHDDLTSLPNRTLFRDRVEQALLRARRNGSSFAVMLVDLDRFKDVNDTLGHQSGDALLTDVAARLLRTLREGDTVARLGGDEFGILATELSDAATAGLIADKLRLALGAPIAVAGLEIEVEASVGIAIFPEHGADVETLIRHADISMYVSKDTHTPIVYATEYDHNSLARLTLVGELRRALEREELVVYYQPQADAVTGEVRRVEALVRWQHPEHGLLAPDKFIPLAEQSGLIRSLTRYVLDASLCQCNTWSKEGHSVGVAVNITGRELVDLRFPDEVAELLGKWNVEPSQLELEITETTILTDPLRAHAVLTRLSELGVRLAIDDFGSGHSSLGYLKRLPINVLKIDKSFVLNLTNNTEDAVIVRSTIDLGHNLDLEVIAEGVETEEAKSRLTALGCDGLQGFLLGRPEPASNLDLSRSASLPRTAVG